MIKCDERRFCRFLFDIFQCLLLLLLLFWLFLFIVRCSLGQVGAERWKNMCCTVAVDLVAFAAFLCSEELDGQTTPIQQI